MYYQTSRELKMSNYEKNDTRSGSVRIVFVSACTTKYYFYDRETIKAGTFAAYLPARSNLPESNR